MDAALFKEMMESIHKLYIAAPPTAFKDGPEFYAALRAADKAKAYINGDMETLLEMEREDTEYWRNRFFATREKPKPSWAFPFEPQDHIGISIRMKRNDSISSLEEGGKERPPLNTSPVLNPEDDDDDLSSIVHASCASSVSAQRSDGKPGLTLYGLSATPNMGPLLPSPITGRNLALDVI